MNGVTVLKHKQCLVETANSKKNRNKKKWGGGGKKCDHCTWTDDIFFRECNDIICFGLLTRTRQIWLLNITIVRLSIYRTFPFFGCCIGVDISDASP
jgi:hypothetical protein